ncbi:MAG TPA: D-alanine--D-alanine ligase [Azospirillaceae bacterium]|nr:D-alanine--D-alanine ligase [Azospirillaceae bacterium]
MTEQTQQKHVAVLLGGWSAEREVSLVSGASVVGALESVGYRVTAVDVQRDLLGLMKALHGNGRPDVIFNALHGRGGEDGLIQGVLEYLHVPYTHSGVMASAVAMDKDLTKRILATVGMPVAEGVVATREQCQAGDVLPRPYVVKPVDEGSSVGVRIVHPGDNYGAVGAEGWVYGEKVLVERYIPGRELTVGIMGDRALAVTEIVPRTDFFDYKAKYTEGQAVHVCPADIPADVAEEAKRLALLAHKTLGCSGISRSDFRWDDTRAGTGGLCFLEINTQPGFTPLSLLPEQAAHLGMSYADVCSWLVENAKCHA